MTSPARDDHEGIVPDWRDRRAALDRLQRQADHTRICTWLDQLAPLTRYYSRSGRRAA